MLCTFRMICKKKIKQQDCDETEGYETNCWCRQKLLSPSAHVFYWHLWQPMRRRHHRRTISDNFKLSRLKLQAWNFLWKIIILKNKIIILFTSLKCHPLSRCVFFVVCSSLTVDQGRSFMAAPVTLGLTPLFSWPEGLLADRCGCRKELLNSNDEFEIIICMPRYLFEWEGEFLFPCL